MKKQITKKSLSILLSMALLLAVFAMPAMARNSYTYGNTDAALIRMASDAHKFYENFEGEKGTETVTVTTSSPAYYGAMNNNSFGATCGGVSNTYITTDGALFLDGSSGKASFIMNDKGTKLTPGMKWTIDFKFKLGAIGADSMLYLMQRANYAGVRLEINSEGKLLTRNGTTGVAISDVLAVDEWYTVKIVVDTTSGDAATSTQSIYLNGRCVQSNGQLYNYSKGFNQKMIQLFNAEVYSPIYYDDLAIYIEPTGRTTYAAEDFNGYSENITWNGVAAESWWSGVAYAPEGNNVATINAAEGRLEVGESGFVMASYYNETTASKKVNVSFDFTATDVSKNNGLIFGQTDQGANNSGVEITLNNGTLYALNNDKEYVKLKEGIEAGRTYNIVVSTDISANNCNKLYDYDEDVTEAGHYSVYVDGECVGSQITFAYSQVKVQGGTELVSGSTKAPNLGRVIFIRRGEDVATCYYDNFVIFGDEREYLLDDAFEAVETAEEALKENVTSFALQTGTEAYPITWTSSDSDVIAIDGATATVTRGAEAQNVTLTAVIADSANTLALTRTINVEVPGVPAPSIADVVKDGDTTSVTATLTGAYDGVQLIAAVYDANGKMLGLDMEVTDGTTASATVTLTELAAGDYTTRLFVLDSLNSFRPLIPSTDKAFSIE